MVIISDQTKRRYYTNKYHKTGLYSLYDSYYKLRTLNAVLHRAWKICTNYNQFDVEVNKTREKFNKLCYPKFILDKYDKNFVEKKIVGTIDETTNNKREEIIIKLPYIGDIAKRLVKLLNKVVLDTGINTTVRGVFKEQKIRKYFKLKDKTPKHLDYNQILYIK